MWSGSGLWGPGSYRGIEWLRRNKGKIIHDYVSESVKKPSDTTSLQESFIR